MLLACFGRAISEVGAVMIVGGNIEGFTRVMTTAIALETSKGDLPLALALGIVLLAVVLALNAVIALVHALARRACRRRWCWRERPQVMSGWVQLQGVDLRYGAVRALRGRRPARSPAASGSR